MPLAGIATAQLDIDLVGESGFDLARRLHRQASRPPARMILISTHAEQGYADLIAASPAAGFPPSPACRPMPICDLLRGYGDGPPVDPVRGVEESDHREDAVTSEGENDIDAMVRSLTAEG
jgi:hypothetical protein